MRDIYVCMYHLLKERQNAYGFALSQVALNFTLHYANSYHLFSLFILCVSDKIQKLEDVFAIYTLGWLSKEFQIS